MKNRRLHNHQGTVRTGTIRFRYCNNPCRWSIYPRSYMGTLLRLRKLHIRFHRLEHILLVGTIRILSYRYRYNIRLHMKHNCLSLTGSDRFLVHMQRSVLKKRIRTIMTKVPIHPEKKTLISNRNSQSVRKHSIPSREKKKTYNHI